MAIRLMQRIVADADWIVIAFQVDSMIMYSIQKSAG